MRELSMIDDQLRILDAKADEAANDIRLTPSRFKRNCNQPMARRNPSCCHKLTECNVVLRRIWTSFVVAAIRCW